MKFFSGAVSVIIATFQQQLSRAAPGGAKEHCHNGVRVRSQGASAVIVRPVVVCRLIHAVVCSYESFD